jgi:ribosomal-protein-alanine N-acetyltransferase
MLRGQSIVLTEVRKADSQTFYRWINDAETVRFNAPWKPIVPDNHNAWFDGIGKNGSQVVLAIREADDESAIGYVQLINIHPIHRSAELTIRIGDADKRGKGCGTVALKLALDFARRDLNLQRVWLRVFAGNGRAIRAYEKAGFEREGVMRRAAWIDGDWRDEIIMAALTP